jgi:predicted CXXCH cytochrome family protein
MPRKRKPARRFQPEAHPRTSSSAPVAAWRAGRGRSVLLVGGALLLAVAAVLLVRAVGERSGDAARAEAPAPAAAPGAHAEDFVGAATCASCHQQQHTAWSGSHHQLAMQEATAESVLGDFAGASYSYGGVSSTFYRDGDRFFVRTDATDGSLRDFEVKYTFGVYPIQQYLLELPGGHIHPLSISWDSRPAADGGQRWFHLYPGQGIEHTDELHWTGRQQNWNFMCADCHSTYVRKGYDAESDAFQTTWAEINVGCEACHGPGARHVDWARAPRALRSLLWRDNGLTARLDERRGGVWSFAPGAATATRSAPLAPAREVQVCAQCHSHRAQIAEGYIAGAPFHDYYTASTLLPGLFHPDGQQLDEVYTHASFLQSRMFAAGVTCSDCHEAHSQQLRAPGNQVCAQCHAPAAFDTPTHHFHLSGGPGSQCVSCHMPETTYMLIDPRRDHSIRVPRPDLTVEIGVPNACNDCHAEQGAPWAAARVRDWLGRDAAGFQQFAREFHADQTGQAGAGAALREIAASGARPAVVRASALSRLATRPGSVGVEPARAGLGDPDPMVRRASLLVLESLEPAERLRLAVPLLRDPSRSVRIQAAWLLAPAHRGLSGPEAGAFSGAADEFIASQRFNADRAENRVNLGGFLAQLGRTGEAMAEYRAAIRLAPAFVPAYVNLADLYRAAGLEAETERALREGIAAAPGDAALRYALGLSLVRSGRVPEAMVELQRAAEFAPENPAYAYTYAVALNSSGRAREAIATLERARERHPTDPDLLFTLATIHRDGGDLEAARRYAALLAEADPDDPRGRALLAALARTGAARGP